MFQLENHTDKLSNVNLRAAPSAEDQLKQELAGMDEDEE